jgi:hypothetical protein
MKIILSDYGHCFSIDMEAENLADAAMLVNFSLNSTKEIRSKNASFVDKGIIGYLVVGKRKEIKSIIREYSP